MSRVGLKPISLPEKVSRQTSTAARSPSKARRASSTSTCPRASSLSSEDGNVVVSRATEHRQHRALHGTARSLVHNMITGVSEGFVKDLEIQGVGFRAAVKGKDLDLASASRTRSFTRSRPDSPSRVTDNTKIKVEGIDKQMVGQFAAEVRSYYPPEPYKGKGVRYVGEHVRRKEGKSVGK